MNDPNANPNTDMNASPSARARSMIGLVDLTRLEDPGGESESEAQAIRSLCLKAGTVMGPVAAVCVHPAWVGLADQALSDAGLRAEIRLATVANFPDGTGTVEATVDEIRTAVAAGADEIDVVFPWKALCEGHSEDAQILLSASRMACPNQTMKVILESGELDEPALIRQAAEIAIACGADFLKTSTGNVKVNATLPAATVMLETIRDCGRDVGFKASGGLRSTDDAARYLALAEQMMGPEWIGANHLRFGASSLLDDLLTRAGAPNPPA